VDRLLPMLAPRELAAQDIKRQKIKAVVGHPRAHHL